MEKGAKHFDEWSKEYSKVTFVGLYFLNELFKKIVNEVNGKAPSVLDIGTGDGKLLLAIAKKNPKCKFIGIDFSEGMLNKARQNFKKFKVKGKFIKGNLENKLPFKSNSINYVVSSTAIHHVRNKERLFGEIYRILKKNGKLLVMDQSDKEDKKYKKLKRELRKNYPKLWTKYSQSFDKLERETLKELKAMKIKHPKEYHLAPFTIKKRLEERGFSELKIIPTPKFFVIYFAKKS